jgi:hypothetical protein
MKNKIIKYLETQDFTEDCTGNFVNGELEISIFTDETGERCFLKCINTIFNNIDVWSFWTSNYKDFINKFKILTQ